ncbi:15721_t:CDS:1 [Dentiscutata erythropus]|uniref:Protein-serine/threonine kinase n=1 Tax=Dentiscutata erythropus TaxID=1348616 RepID=A0A9N9FSK0_9GLOM|nr:15721_t:CDS:1 [Dentiscutata erythropus]
MLFLTHHLNSRAQTNFSKIGRSFPIFLRNSRGGLIGELSFSSTTSSKAEPIQYTSLHPNFRTVSPNHVTPPPPPTSITSSTTQSLPQVSVKPIIQSRAYSPQHFYQNRILDQYASQPITPITLRQLIVFGRNLTEERIVKSGNYVRSELPIRIAHRIRDFQNLPFIVGTNPHLSMVYDLYWSAFEKLRKFPPVRTMEENNEWCETIKGLLKNHLVVIPKLAMGMMECSEHLPGEQIDRFMNTMLRTRISRRVLAEQQVALTENWHDPGYTYNQSENDGWIGVISTQCNAKEIVEKCAKMTINFFKEYYDVEPPQVLTDGQVDTTFAYIPDHIEYIIYELLKNSIKGVIEKHAPSIISTSQSPSKQMLKSSQLFPPITVTICSGPTDIYFRVSDQGGGIPDKLYPYIWSFASKSNDKKILHKFTNFSKVPHMAARVEEYEQQIVPPELSLGIGLPMSKVYAEYWGGSLNIFSLDGYGVDAYVRITKLGNQIENLV